MGKSDDDKLDELMGEMKRKKEATDIARKIFTATGREMRAVNEKVLVELMEIVETCESEEERTDLIEKFFKDVREGKITPYQ